MRLESEIIRLKDDVERLSRRHPDDEDDEVSARLGAATIAHVGLRLERLRATLAGAEVLDSPDRVVIGRRMKLREDNGMSATYTLASPGEGSPSKGLIAADSPLGRAVLGCQASDQVEVDAPAGRRTVRIEWVG